jgi:hypothetical protein
MGVKFTPQEKERMEKAQMSLMLAAAELVSIKPKEKLADSVFKGWAGLLMEYAVKIEVFVEKG